MQVKITLQPRSVLNLLAIITIELPHIQQWHCSDRTGLRQPAIFRIQDAFARCSETSNCVLHFQRDVSVQTYVGKTWHQQSNMQTAEICSIRRQMTWSRTADLHDSLCRGTQITACSRDGAAFLCVLCLLGKGHVYGQYISWRCTLMQQICSINAIGIFWTSPFVMNK